MIGDVEALKRLSTDRVACPIGFAVPDEVWNDVRRWPLRYRAEADQIHKVCAVCDQSVVRISTPKGTFVYTDITEENLVLTHLIQAHRWTREGMPHGE